MKGKHYTPKIPADDMKIYEHINLAQNGAQFVQELWSVITINHSMSPEGKLYVVSVECLYYYYLMSN